MENNVNITNKRKVVNCLGLDLSDALFPLGRRLIPNLNDFYELELAFYENKLLSDTELINNGAYFSAAGGEYTHHFLMCTGETLKLPNGSSSRLKSFFENNIFRTGYATHGLFPYRGKFHPQMIKGLINIMGLKPGDTVLDPMMGSGTVLVEASLMKIKSMGFDASPFCQFMTQAKLDTLTMPLVRAKGALNNCERVFAYFQKKVGQPKIASKINKEKTKKTALVAMEEVLEYSGNKNHSPLTDWGEDTTKTYNFLLLAYLDSAGYSERSNKRNPLRQFEAILERYLFVAGKIQNVLSQLNIDPTPAEVFEGDARELPLPGESIDGIIFSPPYSFAIDYLANDSFHLNYMGVEVESLRERMVGLRGRNLSEKYQRYREDMVSILSECARVLRRECLCTIIVGTNSNQLGKVLGVSPDEVMGLHEILIDIGVGFGLKLVKKMSRPITGITNTMRREYILIFQKK